MGQWTVPTRLTLGGGGSRLSIVCLLGDQFLFCLFKDVEREMGLGGPEAPRPGEPQRMPGPPPGNAGVSMLPALISPGHVAEVGAWVSSPWRPVSSRPVGGPNPPRLPTYRSTQSTLNNGALVSDDGRENRVSGNAYCACAKPVLDLYFFGNFHGAQRQLLKSLLAIGLSPNIQRLRRNKQDNTTYFIVSINSSA